ncbi:MAG: serine hydrolase domain-containing protein, partial [Luteolibacter sp.]
QQPAWRLEDGHGYHPRTFGALLDEPVRRLSGMSLGRYWCQRIAEPLGLQFWIGLPESEWSRVATLYPGKVTKGGEADAFYQQLSNANSYTHRAFFSPSGLHSIHEMNHSRAWSAGLPAMGGVGTASALAKFYQAAMGTIPSPLSQKLREALATPVSRAEDRVLLRPTVFSCGAQLDPLTHDGQKARFIFGSSRLAFGHPGAGGSHAMADPQSGISFAYTMNQMSLSVMPGSRCLEMIDGIFPAET